jgi:hypothetical protein
MLASTRGEDGRTIGLGQRLYLSECRSAVHTTRKRYVLPTGWGVMNPQGHIYLLTEDALVFEIAQVPLYGTCHADHRWGCVYADIVFSFQPSAMNNALTAILP